MMRRRPVFELVPAGLALVGLMLGALSVAAAPLLGEPVNAAPVNAEPVQAAALRTASPSEYRAALGQAAALTRACSAAAQGCDAVKVEADLLVKPGGHTVRWSWLSANMHRRVNWQARLVFKRRGVLKRARKRAGDGFPAWSKASQW